VQGSFRIRDVGYRATRPPPEKGYVYWSAEIGPDYDPLSAGLDWAVDFGKDFIGKSALLDVKKNGAARRLCLFTIDAFAPLLGGETILKDGKVVGQTASCGFGHTVGRTIASWLLCRCQ
jgi:4-methylaminobutanoate oxidase (formaldehyde-forming)